MNRSVLVLAVVGLVAAAAPAGAAPTAEGTGSDVLPAAAHADRDGDGLSDDLEHLIAGRPAHERIDVIVTLDGPGDARSSQQAVGRFRVTQEFGLVRGFAATMTVGQARALSARVGVFRVEPDFEVTTQNDVSNEDFGTAAARLAADVDGTGTEVCVIDTGVDPGHEQLDSKADGGGIPFFDAVNGQMVAYDDHGHGTHVAATAVGDGVGSADAWRYAGVAPGAALSAAKVLAADGSGTASQVVAGVDWCAARGSADVLSMSLGSSTSSDGKDAISQAVNEAVGGGKVVVVAAGNGGDAPLTVGSPGAAGEAITVGAAAEWSSGAGIDANASRGIHLAPWSSRGPTADGRTKPDITAPGVSITSAQHGTTSGYVTWSGTSMATPFTAGTVALMLESDATMQPADVKATITGTAQDRGIAGPDDDWGHGLLDGYAAVVGDGTTAFPEQTSISASVADHGSWTWTFEVADTSVPIAATILVDGDFSCSWRWLGSCLMYEWTGPDLDVRLLDPAGTIVDDSACPLGCHTNSIGRQETIEVMPTTTGTYTLEIYPFDGSPNDGAGGTFTVDLSHGASATDTGGGEPETEPTPPTASFTQTCTDLTCTFTDTSTDSDGEIVSWAWDLGDGASSTAKDPVHAYGAGGTYTVTLTVTDIDGRASEPASVEVTVAETTEPVAPILTVTGDKIKGTKHAELAWVQQHFGEPSGEVDVLRDGTTVATTANDGEHTDVIGKGGGSHTYQVCGAGTDTCSNEVTVSF